MKLINTKGQLVTVDIRPSTYYTGEAGKSKLQNQVGEYLREKYTREVIIEEFVIPGSKMRIDFFLPHRNLAIEVSPESSHSYNPFFHGEKKKNKYGKQVLREIKKQEWCENNDIDLLVITTEKDIENFACQK